jgi:putative transposase
MHTAVTRDGERFENQKPFRRAIGRVKRLQRTVSRRLKGSQNRTKALRQLACAHYRVACVRADIQHKLTTRLAQQAALLGIEDLNVVGMLKNRRLAGGLADAGLGELHRQLGYKAAWYGGQVVRVARFYPSSRIRHGCGGYKGDMELSDRTWTCPACGALVDRDLNAARNIRDEALRLSAGSVVATSSRQGPVDTV